MKESLIACCCCCVSYFLDDLYLKGRSLKRGNRKSEHWKCVCCSLQMEFSHLNRFFELSCSLLGCKISTIEIFPFVAASHSKSCCHVMGQLAPFDSVDLLQTTVWGRVKCPHYLQNHTKGSLNIEIGANRSCDLLQGSQIIEPCRYIGISFNLATTTNVIHFRRYPLRPRKTTQK